MECSNASKLLRELKGDKFIPKYNFDQVEKLQKESRDLIHKLRNTVEQLYYKQVCNRQSGNDEQQQQEILHHTLVLNSIIFRNKRCILAYLNTRLNKIDEAYWEFGSNIPQVCKEFMSNDELNYMESYKQIVSDYQRDFPFEIEFDLNKDLEPPHDLFIQIKVIDDIGQIITTDGEEHNFQKNTLHYVKRSDVEHFILDGKMQLTGF